MVSRVDEIHSLVSGVRNGSRRHLANAITLAESDRAEDRERTCALIEQLWRSGVRESVRIGLTGPPGVGKSTFIEGFGRLLIRNGFKIAVLAVDPSSTEGGGSVLGDKTRMPSLAQDHRAFIRPSPAKRALGGVERRTHEAVFLCEQAGYDLVLVESTGVGQTETTVSKVTDLFVLMLHPGGGDELQGIKRGIMEEADLIVVNKADGDLKTAAQRTMADYAAALRLLRRRERDPSDFPKALVASAADGVGFERVWTESSALADWRRANGHWHLNRAEQAKYWFAAEIQEAAIRQFRDTPHIADLLTSMEQRLERGEISGTAAASAVVAAYRESSGIP